MTASTHTPTAKARCCRSPRTWACSSLRRTYASTPSVRCQRPALRFSSRVILWQHCFRSEFHSPEPQQSPADRLMWFVVCRPGVHKDGADGRASSQPGAQCYALCPPRPGPARGAARGCELDRVPLLRRGLLHHRPGCAPAGQACTCSTNLCLHNQQPGAALGSGVCGLRVGRTCVCSAGYLIDGGYTSC